MQYLKIIFWTGLACNLEDCTTVKDYFQSVLRSLRTLMFVNIINGSPDGMQINVIR